MSLTQWDREIAPYLQTIESRGRQITTNVDDVSRAIFILQSRPAWRTKAIDELENAEHAIAALLERMRTARARYDQLPIAG